MTGPGRGSGRWYRRRAEARANIIAGGRAGAGAGRRKPRIRDCSAVPRQAGGYEVRISGADLTAGAVPISGRVGDRRISEIRGVSPSELTAVVETCEAGDRIELDLGPFGSAVGTVASVEKPPRRPSKLPRPLDRLLSRLRDRLRGSR